MLLTMFIAGFIFGGCLGIGFMAMLAINRPSLNRPEYYNRDCFKEGSKKDDVSM